MDKTTTIINNNKTESRALNLCERSSDPHIAMASILSHRNRVLYSTPCPGNNFFFILMVLLSVYFQTPFKTVVNSSDD